MPGLWQTTRGQGATDNVNDIAGRTAFITGGANGIGLGIARAFARAGARIALADVDKAALGIAQAELAKATQVEAFVLDVLDRDAWLRRCRALSEDERRRWSANVSYPSR